mgnify:CR=1 FL=1
MLDLLILIFVAWAAYNIGVSVTAWRLREFVYKEAKARGMVSKEHQELFEGQKEEKPKVSQLWIEKVQDIMYLYEKDTDDFVCQANTLEELANLALKYKNIKYASVMNGDDVFAFVNGSVKTSEEILK